MQKLRFRNKTDSKITNQTNKHINNNNKRVNYIDSEKPYVFKLYLFFFFHDCYLFIYLFLKRNLFILHYIIFYNIKLFLRFIH